MLAGVATPQGEFEFNALRYRYFTQAAASWSQAAALCAESGGSAMGMSLATVNSELEMTTLKNQIIARLK